MLHTGTGLNAIFEFVRPIRPVIIIDVDPNHLYIVRFSEKLRYMKHGQEIARLHTTSQKTEQMTVPLKTTGKEGFRMMEGI